MAEQTFLDEGGVTVTNARFVVPGQTYAMSGITSVKNAVESPSKKGPIILIILGVLFLLAGKSAILPAILFIGSGIAWLMLSKPTYNVQLHSASGEAKAFQSKEKGSIDKIISALNEAIIHRG